MFPTYVSNLTLFYSASQMTHNLALCLFGDVQSSFKTIRETKQIHQNYLEKNNVKGIYKPTQALSLGEGAVQVCISSRRSLMIM